MEVSAKLHNFCYLPTPYGQFRMYDSGDEALRIVTYGAIGDQESKPIIRLHSSCLASEVFEAHDCDCADQLRETMKLMAHEGGGIIFHLHQEGRGQGLSNKIHAVYKMQSENIDTADSFDALGLEQDIRQYGSAIDILNKLDIKQVRLVSNNPRKKQTLLDAGIDVEVVNTHPKVRPENADYLQSKNDKLGHCLPLANTVSDTSDILFYHSDQAWGDFSNFSQHAIFLKGKIWQTVEHFYQAQKFAGTELEEKIRISTTPMLAKQMANGNVSKMLEKGWEENKEMVMYQGLYAKFLQHPNLKKMLIDTQSRHIAEHTRNDLYWGDGGDGTGKNRLGNLLMQLRAELAMESVEYAKEQTCAA